MSSAGRRDKLVLLENPGPQVPDGEGGWTEGWALLNPPQMYAHLAPATQSDLERVASGTVIASATHVIGLPYHPEVTIQTRLRYSEPGRGERIFAVTALRNPDEADRELVLVAEEQL
jgi:head-tail adaptor